MRAQFTRLIGRKLAGLFLYGLCAPALIASASFAGPAQLVRNINDSILPQGSHPNQLGMLGGRYLFGAQDAEGAALWTTDGTQAGTRRLHSFGTGSGVYFNPSNINLSIVNGRAFFIAADESNGMELWSTDGTSAGTHLAVDFTPGTNGSNIRLHGVLGNQILFDAYDSLNGTSQLYISDGTSAGTRAITSLSGYGQGLSSDALYIADTKFYYVIFKNNTDYEMWVSDGTVAGTHRVNDPYSSSFGAEGARKFHRVGNRLIYSTANAIWSIDMTTDTIEPALAQNGTAGSGPPSGSVGDLAEMNGFAMFLSSGPVYSSIELWRSDGTATGTSKIVTANTQPTGNEFQYPLFVKVGSRVVYLGSDSTYGPQLWGSDGTAQNTVRLTNTAAPANTNTLALPVGVFGSWAYFMISDGASAGTYSLWKTDGTLAGTARVPGIASIDFTFAGSFRMAGDANAVFFTAVSNSSEFSLDYSLWHYDRVAGNTTLLKQTVHPVLQQQFFFDGTRLYFSHEDSLGDEPWVSDGTVQGTQRLADLNPQSTSDQDSAPQDFAELNGLLYFAADDYVHGRELWVTDGTAAGTKMVADIARGPYGSNPNHLVALNGYLTFFASDGFQKFMRFDPKTEEIEREMGPGGPQPSDLPALWTCQHDEPVVMNGYEYFLAQAGGPYELWKTDGTVSGTTQLTNYNMSYGFPCSLTVWKNRIYFALYGLRGYEPWVTDGTVDGTVHLAEAKGLLYPSGFTDFNGSLYFFALEPTHGGEIWKTDGTPSGTQLAADLVPGAGSSSSVPLAVVNGRLLLQTWTQTSSAPVTYEIRLASLDANDNATSLGSVQIDPHPRVLVNGGYAYFGGDDGSGMQPWVTDGTPAGTRKLGPPTTSGTSTLAWFANFNGMTVLAMRAAGGMELWRTDGTDAGTVLMTSLAAQAASSPVPYPTSYRQQLAVRQSLFFVASETATGIELYSLTNTSPIAAADNATATSGVSGSINVLANDTDADGALDSETIEITSQPTHGTASRANDGSIQYTPASGFSGSDSFAYTVKDRQGAVSNAATVTVTVTAPATSTTPPGSSGGKGGGGGGSFGLVALLSLASLLTLRRRDLLLSGRASSGRVSPWLQK